jgi:subtilase family serine protease
LLADAAVETAHSPAFGSDGALYLAYQKVQTELVTRTFAVSPTLSFTVTGMPVPGTSALAFLGHAVGRDLSFDSLSVAPANPAAGQLATLTAVLRNTGDLAVENPQAAFYDGATPIGSVQTLPTLAAGYTTTVEVSWTVPAPAAAHVLSAVADPAGLVAETDETNNEVTTLTTLPDLKVEVLYTTQSAGDGGIITATARLVNAGALTASALFDVALRAADPLTGALLGAALVESDLAAGAQVTITLAITDAAALAGLGETLWAMADDGQVVSEADEENNTAYAPLYVLPDLTLSAADIYGSEPITVTVRNAGLVTATGASLAVWQGAPGTASTLVYSGTLSALGPGANSAITLTVPSLPAELWAQADPANDVAESDESNNLAVRTVEEVEGLNWIYLPVLLRN